MRFDFENYSQGGAVRMGSRIHLARSLVLHSGGRFDLLRANFVRLVFSLYWVLVAFGPVMAHADIVNEHVLPALDHGFDPTGFKIIGVGLLATYAASTSDEYMRNEWGGNKNIGSSQSRVGDILGTGIPGIAIAISQIFLDRENGIAHSEALFASFLTTSALKYTNSRQRPGNPANRQSMPSGHTSTTFTTASALTSAYGWYGAIPAYLLAAFTGLTRISDDAHWYSDTVAGATIGIFWGRATHFHHAPGSYEHKYGTFQPWQLNDGGWGLHWAKHF